MVGEQRRHHLVERLVGIERDLVDVEPTPVIDRHPSLPFDDGGEMTVRRGRAHLKRAATDQTVRSWIPNVHCSAHRLPKSTFSVRTGRDGVSRIAGVGPWW